MSNTDTEKPQESMTLYQKWRGRAALAAGTALVTLAPYASATTLNESIYPLIEDMADLFVPLLDLVIAAVPVIIAVMFVGFITGIFDGILRKF